MRLILAILLLPAIAAADHATDVVAEVEHAIASADPKTPLGETTAIVQLAPATDIEADVKAVHKELLARGFRILFEDETTFTVERKRARATIAIGQRSGAIIVTPNPSATRPPGKCVAIPKVTHPVYVTSSGIDDGGERFEGSTHWIETTTRGVDVDGDGIPDMFVPEPASKNACPETIMWRVYAMRGACGHDLGLVGPGLPHLGGPLDASGFKPLVAESTTATLGKKHPIPEHTATTNRYTVAKSAYKLVDTKASTGTCHHCATWSCAGG